MKARALFSTSARNASARDASARDAGASVVANARRWSVWLGAGASLVGAALALASLAALQRLEEDPHGHGPADTSAHATAHAYVTQHPQPERSLARPRHELATGVAESAKIASSRKLRIFEPAGEVVREGLLSLRCASGDLTSVSLATADEDGFVAVPTCAGLTCAALTHPTLELDLAFDASSASPLEGVAQATNLVTGVVIDREARPILGANVVHGRHHTTTDEDGAFALLPDGLARARPTPSGCHAGHETPGVALDGTESPFAAPVLAVYAPGWKSKELRLDPNDPTPTATVVLEPATFTLRGRTSTSPAETKGAIVLLRNQARPYERRRAPVHDGRFHFDALEGGRYDLRLVLDGRVVATATGVDAGHDIRL